MVSSQRLYQVLQARCRLLKVYRLRQYVHRVQEKWGKKKYKKETPNNGNTPPKKTGKKTRATTSSDTPEQIPSHSVQSSGGTTTPANVRQRQPGRYSEPMRPSPHSEAPPRPSAPPLAQALSPRPDDRRGADILYALGNGASAFPVYLRLNYTEPMVHHVVACARAVQTRQHALQAHDLLGTHVNDILVRVPDGESSLALFFDLLSAHTWDFDEIGNRANDRESNRGIGQLEEQIQKIVEDEQERLKPLVHRPYNVDVPLYQLLSYALRRWNDNTAEGAADIDAEGILAQFLAQQPAYIDSSGNSPVLDMHKTSCVSSCLRWCLETLERGPSIPSSLSQEFDPKDLLLATYQVSCTLLIRLPDDYSRSDWANSADSQLNILPPELLVTVVCMIVGEASRMSLSGIDDALALACEGARSLTRINNTTLVDRFLHQVRLNSDKRLSSPSVPVPKEHASMFAPFRNFIATYFRLSLSQDVDAGFVHPLVLDTGEDRSLVVPDLAPRQRQPTLSPVPPPLQDRPIQAPHTMLPLPIQLQPAQRQSHLRTPPPIQTPNQQHFNTILHQTPPGTMMAAEHNTTDNIYLASQPSPHT